MSDLADKTNRIANWQAARIAELAWPKVLKKIRAARDNGQFSISTGVIQGMANLAESHGFKVLRWENKINISWENEDE